MGQMHTQMAAEDPNGPSVVVATELNQERMEELNIRFGPAAQERGAMLMALNPRQLTPEEYEEKLKRPPAASSLTMLWLWLHLPLW